MPKKKAKSEKKAKKDIEKDEILRELANKLKEIRDEELSDEDEESGLEEDLDMEALDFNEFIQPMHLEDVGAPVLERIAGSQPGPIFVGGISQTPQTIPGEEKQSDEFKYVPGQGENEELKYIEADSRISRGPERIDFTRIGRETEITPVTNQEAFFMRSEPGSQTESMTPERTWKAEGTNIERAGREDPFKKEEAKYEKYKPKLPKSY